jgi:sialate O-acetylesterase
MAVTTDIGDPHDIHPRNKQDVGKRLAALALNRTYGKKFTDSGPVFESMKVNAGKIVITFTNTGKGLMVKDKYGYVKGFEIAGAEKQFRYAKATVEGNTVIVHHDSVSDPVAVRFGWADDASDNNLFNAEGFPAAPFRTDTWKGITEDAKFRF